MTNKSQDEEGKAVESELQAELDKKRPPPKTKLAKARRKGGELLHSKHVLITIVILNLVDCILVLGELILDIHYVRDVLEKSDMSSQRFIDKMEESYPHVLSGHDIEHIDSLYLSIYNADCFWEGDDPFARVKRCSEDTVANGNNAASDLELLDKAKKAHAHSIWEDIAHGLHKASIAILAFLFLENLAKIFCAGLDFLSHKLEVFDAVIVIISFTLDIVFLKGLMVYRIQDGIFILSFLVPWRVIRVVNSLIVAILDHEHFRLKMLYIRNKRISHELDELKLVEQRFDAHLKKVEKFMETEGIPSWKIAQHTHFHKQQSTLASMASLAMGGIVSGLLEKNAFMGPMKTPEINRNDVIKSEQVGVAIEESRHEQGQ